MIIGTGKSLDEILDMTAPYERILVVGCDTCMTVCLTGGRKETTLIASAIELRRKSTGKNTPVRALTVKRQCEPGFAEDIMEEAAYCDAILSLGCASGTQNLAAMLPATPVLPGIDTRFIGMPVHQRGWIAACRGCGHCMIHLTGGICAVTRCPKSMVNGPCGGETPEGMCEVGNDIPCVWMEIGARLKNMNRLDQSGYYIAPIDWSRSAGGGALFIQREDDGCET